MQPHQLPKLTKKQKNILAAAEKKRFCDQRALHIVELLIEPEINEEWLLHQLQYIDQQHYHDVTEERSCTGLCGYPLCANKIGKMPTNQFQISTNTNRIYDITERKKYCSNACFRSSRHLKPQIQTTPLWLRDQEPPPVFKLLNQDNNKRGIAGDPVDLGVARMPADEPSPVTTDQVAAGMMHQFDELSQQIRDLALKPEEELEAADEPVRGSSLKRAAPGRPDTSPENSGTEARPPAKTVQFAEERTQGVASSGLESPGSPDAVGCPKAQPETPTGNAEDSTRAPDESVHSQEAQLETPAQQPAVQRAACAVSEKQSSGREVPVDGAEEARSAPGPAEQPAPPAAPTCGFKRPVRSSRRQEHPLKVVEARLLDWMSTRSQPTWADPLRVQIPAAGDGASGAGDSGSPAEGDASGSAAPIISPSEAAARNQALLAYLQGQVRLPPAAPPRRRPDAEPQLDADGRPVPPEPLLESQDKQRRHIVHQHLTRAMARLLPPFGLVMTDVTSPLRQTVAHFHLTAVNVTMTPSQWTLAAIVLLRRLLRDSSELMSLARDVDYSFSTALQPFQVTLKRLDCLVDKLPTAAPRPAPT